MTAVTNSINNNKPTTGNTTVANKSTSKPNSIIDEGSKNRIELTNNDLQKHIKNLKINLSESDTNRLISFVSGKTIDELNNLTSDEITCIINKIDKAMAMLEEDIATHKRKDKKIDISLIINYIRLTNGEIPKGWDSIDSFRNKQKRNMESLSDRLYRMYGVKDITKSKDELAFYLKKYFEQYFNKLEKQGLSRDEVDIKQFTDFTKLLFNSTQEEYSAFRDALEYLVANNRGKGYEAILKSFDRKEDCLKFGNETSYQQTQTWATTPDQRGEIPSEKQAAEITAAVIKYKDAESIQKYHNDSFAASNDFYNGLNDSEKELLNKIISKDKNILDQIKAIQDKIKESGNLDCLNDQEKRLLEIFAMHTHFKGDNAGQMIGTGANNFITEEEKDSILQVIHTDVKKIATISNDESFYDDVLTTVANYVQENENEFSENFNNLMNKHSENKYGEIYTKVAESKNSGENPQGGLGFTIKEPTNKNNSETNNSINDNRINSYNDNDNNLNLTNNDNYENSVLTQKSEGTQITSPIVHSESLANNDTISEEAKFKSLTVVEMAKFISDCSDTIKNQFKQIYMALTPNVKKIVMMTSAPSTLDLLLSWSTNSEIMNLNHNLFINEYSRNKIAKLQEKINAKQ